MATISYIANDWIELDPILEDGQPGVEIDTGRVKFGDGEHSWLQLEYTPYINYMPQTSNVETKGAMPVPEDFGAKADGVTDDTAAFSKMFKLGGNISLTPGKTYFLGGTGIQVYSNTNFYASGAKMIVASGEPNVDRTYGFIIDDSQSNILLEGMDISSPRDKEGELIDGTLPKQQDGFKCSNSHHLSIYQDVHNVVVRNYRSDGAYGAIVFRAHTTEKPTYRSNLLFENLWFTNQSMPISGGHGANGLTFNNVYIECADTTRKYHAVYLRTNMHGIRFNNFYIKQPKEVGQPFSIYTINKSAESCAVPVYFSNGEVHAGSLLTTSNPYEAHMHNVRLVNDNPEDFANGTCITHYEQSFGYYNNCEFINCYQIRNGEFNNCYFKLKTDKANWFVYGLGVATPPTNIPAVSAERTDAEWHDIADKIERLVLNGCHIDMRHGDNFIYLFQSGNAESPYPFRIDIKNCLIEDTAGDSDKSFGYIVTQQNAKPIWQKHIINITDCDFNCKFNYDIFKSVATQTGTVDLTVKRCSFNSNKNADTFFTATDTNSKVNKKYIYCDLNNEII